MKIQRLPFFAIAIVLIMAAVAIIVINAYQNKDNYIDPKEKEGQNNQEQTIVPTDNNKKSDENSTGKQQKEDKPSNEDGDITNPGNSSDMGSNGGTKKPGGDNGTTIDLDKLSEYDKDGDGWTDDWVK
ncbi:MAG TPA: hypothetical protein DER23_01600 [Clostridiales bacterium]|mgnify:FL=1|jgi:hypothetical protein|nr:hypothetical protein [Clostridiales bacterium]